MLIYLSMIESEADKSLFEQLYIRYKGLMYHIAYRILQNREDAEDAVHQAFVSLAKNIKKLQRSTVRKPMVTSLLLLRGNLLTV